MLAIELLSLLGINLLCFISLAFTAKKEDLILIQAKRNAEQFVIPHSRNNSRTDAAFWSNFHSASDLYRVKALKYENGYDEQFYTCVKFDDDENHSGASPGATKKSKSSGYNSDHSYHSKTLLSISSSTDQPYTFTDRCAILQ